MSTSPTRVVAGFYLAISLVVTYILVGSPLALATVGPAEAPLLVLLGLHYLWGVILLLGSTEYRTLRSGAVRRLVFVPEVLGVFGLLLFLFSFIFALNANMDYVQRFISGGGNLRLALDTRAERLLVWVRIFPLVALNLGVYLFLRLGRYRVVARACTRRGGAVDRVVGPWNLVLVLASAFFITVSQPSFLVIDGIPALGWVALVPLFLVFRSARFGHAVFYGIAFGALSTLMTSYWLGTFNLVSLLIAVASLGSLAWVEDGAIREARLALGSVAPTILRPREVERALVGRPFTVDGVADLRDALAGATQPISDLRASADYRRRVAGNLLLDVASR